MFSPAFENPFGAVIFEAGQIKYSLKILNALEGETFYVHFNNSTADIGVSLHSLAPTFITQFVYVVNS